MKISSTGDILTNVTFNSAIIKLHKINVPKRMSQVKKYIIKTSYNKKCFNENAKSDSQLVKYFFNSMEFNVIHFVQ